MKLNGQTEQQVSDLPVTVNPRPDAPGTVQHVRLGDVLRRFRDPKPEVRELIRRIRATEDKAARNALKKQLPVVIFSGRFAYRNERGIQAYSGLACIDLDAQDNPGKDLIAPKDLLAQDGYVLAVFTSAGGRGLKLLVRLSEPVDPAADVEALRKAHRAGFEAFRSYLRDVYGLVADTTPDLPRGCYVTWDPDLRVNWDARLFPFRNAPEQAPAARPSGDGAVDLELVKSALEAIPMGPGFPYQDWLRIGLALAGTLGVQEAVRLLLTYGGGHPGDTPEYLERTLRSARGEIGLGTVFWYAQQYGWRPPRKQRAAGGQHEPEPPDASEELHFWQPFPVDLLPVPVRDLVRAGAAAIPADPALIALPSLAVLSAAVGSNVRLRLKRKWLEPAALWALIVAPSGTGKTPAQALAVEPVLDLERRAAREYEAALEAYRRRLADWEALPKERRQAVPKPEPPRARRFRVADLTIEALAPILKENPRGVLLWRDEASAWLQAFDRYAQRGGAELHAWIEMYESRPVSIDRKTGDGPIRLERPFVAVVGGIQPHVLQQHVSPTMLSSGFVPRFILAIPPQTRRSEMRWDADVSEEVAEAYARLIRRLCDLEEAELTLSPEAREVFRGWIVELDRERENLPDGPLRSVSLKAEAWAARLALILQCAEDVLQGQPPREVSGETMARAVGMARWAWHEQQRVYALMGWRGMAYEALTKSPAERLLDEMPETFTAGDWEQAVKDLGRSRRTAYYWLEKLQRGGHVERDDAGLYRKCRVALLHSLHSLHSHFSSPVQQVQSVQRVQGVQRVQSAIASEQASAPGDGLGADDLPAAAVVPTGATANRIEARERDDDDGWWDPFEDDEDEAPF